MNITDFNAAIEAQLDRCKSILVQKQGEYAPSVDKLHNFHNAASLQGVTTMQACGGFMAKHIISIFDMISMADAEIHIDTWNEKITDAINYLLILRAIIEDDA